MKLLLVGDPHVTVSELQDAQNLLNGVYDTFVEQKPDHVVFMGDLHHNHNVVRIEVIDFWLRNLERFKGKAVVMVGNHDMSNDASEKSHALQSYRGVAQVVDDVYSLGKGVFVLPYIHSRERFVETANLIYKNAEKDFGFKPTTLLCHQTFDGCQYDNGFYAPDGVSPDLIPFKNVISGHIHTAQVLVKGDQTVTYIGSPRWRTMDDANKKKVVVLYNTDSMTGMDFDTSKWCSPMSSATLTGDYSLEDVMFVNNPRTRYYIDIVGNKSQVSEVCETVVAHLPNAKIRPIYTDRGRNDTVVSEARGIAESLKMYTDHFKAQHGTASSTLYEMVQQRVLNGK